MNIISALRKNIRNIPGWRTNRKILVLESDDWGSERARSVETLTKLKQAGYSVEKCPMTMNDILESNTDLEMLFDALSGFKDKNGNHPIFTGFFNVANPDYKKIKASRYKEYHYLSIPETASKYQDHDRIIELYHKGINTGLFHAEYHGREHLQVNRWLRDLQIGQQDTIFGFEHEFNGFSRSYASQIKKSYRAAYEPDMPADILFMKESVVDGLRMFEDIFKYRSDYFVPPNGPYPRTDNFEMTLKENGIKFLGGPSLQQIPNTNGNLTTKHYSLGNQNHVNQTYITRNGIFEPHSEGKDWVPYCLEDIKLAFRWNKPAIISTHRANFVGSISNKNRESGIKSLCLLLKKVQQLWPDVEFMSSKSLNSLVSGE
ncbi:hypothetical protein [Pontibacter liquoris]|uniref:hypothetical protein n=1 Tax=Pontibacter liquoris TaxID=2905677 RepID=UPI001FA6C1D4|nr:hypothetical protein [Pontibacter liquoris]